MKPIEHEIRRAHPSDARDIAVAHRDSIRSIGALFYPPETVDDWSSGLTGDLYVTAMERGEVFFIAVGALEGRRTVLGFSSHRIDEGQHGTAVYVRGGVARRGIGSALLRVAEAAARSAGATRIDVDASLAGVDFYKARGFEEVGRGDHRLRSGRQMRCVFMRKALAGIDGRALGWAWLGLTAALALHVADEALTGFLDVYNPTVTALRSRLPWLPLPVFSFRVWLAGLVLLVGILAGLSPAAFQGQTWIRPLAYFLSILMCANDLSHVLGTVFGRTVASVRFPRPMPGFYSSPVLIAAATYLLIQLRRSARTGGGSARDASR